MSNEKKFVDIDYPEIAKLFKYPEESHVGSFSSAYLYSDNSVSITE